jgi:hypothetical protein
LLATEAVRTEQPEAMTLRRYALSGPVTLEVLGRCVDSVVGTLATKGLKPRLDEKRIGVCALSAEPCGVVIVSRADGRTEIHYLIRDQKGEPWELTYLIRQADIDRWRPLLAEIEGPLRASTAL